MTPEDAATQLRRHVTSFLARRDHFRPEAGLDEEMGLDLQSSAAAAQAPKVIMLFLFHDDADEGAAGRWVEECLDSARATLPEVFDAVPVEVKALRAEPGDM